MIKTSFTNFSNFLTRFEDFINSKPSYFKELKHLEQDHNDTPGPFDLNILKNWISELQDEIIDVHSLEPLNFDDFPLSLSNEVRMMKICLIGDWAVGKTTLRRRYMGSSFIPNYLPTLGADFSHYRTSYGHYLCELLIWDLAGQPRFQTVRQHYFIGSFGAVVVFDLTRPETFFNMFLWLKEFYEHVKQIKPIVILGNKSDLITSPIQKQEISFFDSFCIYFQHKMLEKYNVLIGYAKTSALTGENVKEGFEQLLHGMLYWIQEESKTSRNSTNP